MPSKQFVVNATPDSPQADQTKFVAPFLGKCFVNFLIIDNIPFNQLSPDPQFHHRYLQNMIEIPDVPFVAGSHVIFDITPVQQSNEIL